MGVKLHTCTYERAAFGPAGQPEEQLPACTGENWAERATGYVFFPRALQNVPIYYFRKKKKRAYLFTAKCQLGAVYYNDVQV